MYITQEIRGVAEFIQYGPDIISNFVVVVKLLSEEIFCPKVSPSAAVGVLYIAPEITAGGLRSVTSILIPSTG